MSPQSIQTWFFFHVEWQGSNFIDFPCEQLLNPLAFPHLSVVPLVSFYHFQICFCLCLDLCFFFPVVCFPVTMLIPRWHNYDGFIIRRDNQQGKSLPCVHFLLVCLGLPPFHVTIRISLLTSMKNHVGIFIRNTLNLKLQFGKMDIISLYFIAILNDTFI